MVIDKNTPIITLWQPWAQWIALGWKTIETRLHDRFKNLKGKIIGIHVGKNYDKNAIDEARNFLNEKQIDYTLFHARGKGGFICCTALVNDFRILTKADSEKALIDCEKTKRYGLFLSNIYLSQEFMCKKYKGRQGIWYIK